MLNEIVAGSGVLSAYRLHGLKSANVVSHGWLWQSWSSLHFSYFFLTLDRFFFFFLPDFGPSTRCFSKLPFVNYFPTVSVGEFSWTPQYHPQEWNPRSICFWDCNTSLTRNEFQVVHLNKFGTFLVSAHWCLKCLNIYSPFFPTMRHNGVSWHITHLKS